jgi:AraC family transcriptional regulator, positive regulator of tynA and feaB
MSPAGRPPGERSAARWKVGSKAGAQFIMSGVVSTPVLGREGEASRCAFPILAKRPAAEAPRAPHGFESAALESGTVGRLRCPPQTALSLPADLPGASTQSVLVLCVLAGAIDVAHAGHRAAAKDGDVVVLTGALPSRSTASGQDMHDIVTLEVPAERLTRLGDAQDATLRLMRKVSASPLASCMRLLAEHLRVGSKEDLSVLYEACLSLLLSAESRLDALGAPAPADTGDNPLLRNILDYTNRNISDGALAPPDVARKFAISVRYLHKLFAANGMTFAAYVTMRRLDHVKGELISGRSGGQTMTALARKWGFRDVSAFNRAFRKRFGCAPRALRARVAS